MTRSERRYWLDNIGNSAAAVAEKYGNSVAKSVLIRYGTACIEKLSPVHYSEAFADLEQILND